MAFHRVIAVADLWNGDLVAADVGGTHVLLVKIDDVVHAYANRCAHLGVALSEGSLAGRVLTCSAHHWQYDVVTGRGVNPDSACLSRFPVKIEGGAVFVEVPDE